MTKEMADFLVKRSLEAGHEARLMEGYSGRFMYGATTWGVVVESPTQLFADIFNFFVNNIKEYDENEVTKKMWDGPKLPPEIGGFREDSLGFNTIIY